VATGRVVIVGGGILGTMHARAALERGWDVVHVEREAEARGASVRNFGLIWVSGRAPGPELELALRARTLWTEVAHAVPDAGFRACGSLTVATDSGELRALEAATAAPDAGIRGFALLTPSEAAKLNPAVGGAVAGALYCSRDAAVEPRCATAAVRQWCEQHERYQWLPRREVVGVGDGRVVDDEGTVHGGDRLVLCTGAAHGGLVGEILSSSPVRRVRLQMLETEPFDVVVPTALADADSLRYYPAFAPWRHHLPPQDPVAEAWEAQLLLVQRRDGALTIGDTHASDEPFPFDVDEAPYRHLLATAERILGAPLPPVARRWAGVYSQVTADGALYVRQSVARDVEIVTGPGGRGMTLSPAIAEETFA
jgi:FAD dependent oxidoreductase TIGR03364